MADLIVVVPSRGRPNTVAELAATFEQTCTANTRLALSIDLDDPAADAYVESAAKFGVMLYVGTNANMAEALHRAVTALPPSYAVGFMGDDHRPRTHGWDASYLEALRDMGTGIVYGNDLYQGERLPTQVAMTSDIVRALGWMTPPGLGHMYLDNFWRDLGASVGCLRYLPDVVVEHMHPVADKASTDEGYERVNAPEVYSRDHDAYRRYLADRFRRDVATVKELMEAHRG